MARCSGLGPPLRGELRSSIISHGHGLRPDPFRGAGRSVVGTGGQAADVATVAFELLAGYQNHRRRSRDLVGRWRRDACLARPPNPFLCRAGRDRARRTPRQNRSVSARVFTGDHRKASSMAERPANLHRHPPRLPVRILGPGRHDEWVRVHQHPPLVDRLRLNPSATPTDRTKQKNDERASLTKDEKPLPRGPV